MTNNIAPSALNMAIAEVLRWTNAADLEQRFSTGDIRRPTSTTRTPSTHGNVAAHRSGPGVATALDGGPGPAGMRWRSDPPGRSCAPQRWWCKPPTIGCAQRVGGAE